MHFARDTSLNGLVRWLQEQVQFFEDRADRERHQLTLTTLSDRERANLTLALRRNEGQRDVWRNWLAEVQRLQAGSAAA